MASPTSSFDAPRPPFPWWGLTQDVLVAGLLFAVVSAVAAFAAMHSIRTGALGGFGFDPLRVMNWLRNTALLVGVGAGFVMGWRRGLRTR